MPGILPTGHMVYAVGGSLFAVAFDVQRLQVTGAQGGDDRGREAGGGSPSSPEGAQFSVSSNGSLVYIPGCGHGTMGSGRDRSNEERVKPLQPSARPVPGPRVSPDGRRIAFGTDDGKEAIVWTHHLSGLSPMSRLTSGGNNRFPTWSSDGKAVVFQSDRDGDRGLFWQPVDEGKAARLTKPDAGEAHEPESWSPNGDTLLFSVTKGSDVSLWMLSLMDKNSAPFGDVHSSTRTGAVFSPDGRWVAYTTTEARPRQIYVQPFPAIAGVSLNSCREVANPNIRCGRRTQCNSSTILAPVSSSSSASRRYRLSVREPGGTAASISRSSPKRSKTVKTSPQMADSCPLSPRDNRSRLANPGGYRLVRRIENASAAHSIATVLLRSGPMTARSTR